MHTAVHLWAAAMLIGLARCATSNFRDRLPATFLCTVEVQNARDASTGENELHQSGRHILRIGFDMDRGSQKGLLHYYLREALSQHSAGKLDISASDASEDEDGESDSCSIEYTAWLMPHHEDGKESAHRNPPPGLVSLCNGAANGTLPINGTHTGRIESLKLLPTESSNGLRHRVSVHPTWSRLATWRQLDRLHRSVGDQIPHDTVVWPAQRLLHRVRRQMSYMQMRDFKYKPEARLQFKRVNVTFNLQTKFLTKFGPYIIQLHVYLDPGLKSRMSDNQDAMVAAAKQVVSYANTLLRPFNTYILVSSLHLPFGYRFPNPDFGVDPLNFLQREYIDKVYPAMNDELIDCVFAFLGRSQMNYTISDSRGDLCTSKHRPSCLGFVIMETDRPNYIRTAGFALAHELGQRLGCGFDPPPEDTSGSCECRFPKCVMEEFVEAIEEAAPIGWSTCSMEKLAASLDWDAGKTCLMLELPAATAANASANATGDAAAAAAGPVSTEFFPIEYSTDWGPTCGNGIVEPGEACDCGGVRGCRSNRCCHPDSCQLADRAKCAVGNCCNLTTCALRVQGSLCRPAADPRCDFPEDCDGASVECPPDVSVSADWPCDEGDVGGLRCRKRHCLAARPGANYSGPGCPSGSVPINAGGCRPKPVVTASDLDGEEEDGGGGGDAGKGAAAPAAPGQNADSDGVGRLRASAAALVLGLWGLRVVWS